MNAETGSHLAFGSQEAQKQTSIMASCDLGMPQWDMPFFSVFFFCFLFFFFPFDLFSFQEEGLAFIGTVLSFV